MRRLPPLNALKMFEASARNLSFSGASEELFVTPSAVSHQVKALENFLGVELFHRSNRKVTLTTQGEQYLRSEEHTSELQSRPHLVCRLLLEKKKTKS